MASASLVMRRSSSDGAHSALVRIRLLLKGASFRIAQTGSDFLFIDSPENHPPARASIDMTVDGSHRTWEVKLPNGIKAGDPRVSLDFAG